MDPAQTMIDNLQKNTGKSLEEWIEIVKRENFQKHGEIMKFLKGTHGFSHGFANLVAHKTLKSDAGSVVKSDDLINTQYKGKEHFKVIYTRLKTEIEGFGDDVEFAPKKAYVSVRRKKQFAMLIPATKTRFEIGINLKGQKPEGLLQLDIKSNGMCSHSIHLTSEKELNKEISSWLKKAYEAAG